MSTLLRAAALGTCAFSLTCVDAPLVLAPAPALACPASTRYVVTGSVEGPSTWLVCCEPKPVGLGAHDTMACGENEVPHGPSLLLFASGHVRVRSEYRDGLADGPVTFWSDKGTLESIGEYAGGKMDGVWTYFRESGVAYYRKSYVDGVEEGLYERWFEDGRLEETSVAHAGQTSGQRRVFFRNGALAVDEHYVAGDLDGLQRRFHDNLQLEREGTWREGKQDGTHASWHSNGARASIEHFAEGEPIGHATWWNDAGDVVMDGAFTDGKRDGAWLEYGWRGSYTAGERDGTWTDGATRVVWAHGLEGPIRPCPVGSKEVIACVARCCDRRGRWCETSSGEHVGPYDAWDTSSGRLQTSNRAN